MLTACPFAMDVLFSDSSPEPLPTAPDRTTALLLSVRSNETAAVPVPAAARPAPERGVPASAATPFAAALNAGSAQATSAMTVPPASLIRNLPAAAPASTSAVTAFAAALRLAVASVVAMPPVALPGFRAAKRCAYQRVE